MPAPEQGLARSASESLAPVLTGNAASVTLRFADPRSGKEVAATLLAATLAQMGEGHSASLVPLPTELSAEQAGPRRADP